MVLVQLSTLNSQLTNANPDEERPADDQTGGVSPGPAHPRRPVEARGRLPRRPAVPTPDPLEAAAAVAVPDRLRQEVPAGSQGARGGTAALGVPVPQRLFHA